MALASYADLKAAIASWLERDDLTTAIPDFVSLAEEMINADLCECAAMRRTVTGLSISSASFSLPATAYSLQSVRLTATDRYLDLVTLDELQSDGAASATGTPSKCAVSGNDDSGTLTVHVWPTPDATYAAEATYSAGVTALSGSQATNFVLTRAPSLYLYGSLIASAPFLKDDQRLSMWQAIYLAGLDRFKSQNWGGDTKLRVDVPVSVLPFDINMG